MSDHAVVKFCFVFWSWQWNQVERQIHIVPSQNSGILSRFLEMERISDEPIHHNIDINVSEIVIMNLLSALNKTNQQMLLVMILSTNGFLIQEI